METFAAPIVAAPRGGAYVDMPRLVVEALGGKGRIAVCATLDGIAYRGSIVSIGGVKVLELLNTGAVASAKRSIDSEAEPKALS